jgi:hypothetical protein
MVRLEHCLVSFSVALIILQPGDELISVDGVMVAGFSFARVRSAVVGAMGSVVELQVTCICGDRSCFSQSHVLFAQLLRASDGVSRRVFVPRCFPVGASSSGWSSMESERCRTIILQCGPMTSSDFNTSHHHFLGRMERGLRPHRLPGFKPQPLLLFPSLPRFLFLYHHCQSGVKMIYVASAARFAGTRVVDIV